MSEVEFDRVLDAVRMAIAPAPEDDFFVYPSAYTEPPKAGNDNQDGLTSFPEGFYAI